MAYRFYITSPTNSSLSEYLFFCFLTINYYAYQYRQTAATFFKRIKHQEVIVCPSVCLVIIPCCAYHDNQPNLAKSDSGAICVHCTTYTSPTDHHIYGPNNQSNC